MNNFDNKAQQTIKNLKKIFDVNYVEKPDIISKYTVGIEIEVKFKYFFPDLFKEYFENKKWNNYSLEDKNRISNLILLEEKSILPILEKTVYCGIPKGNDKYWEFAFTPVNNLTLLIYQIELLRNCNLIPVGRHSLHITIGGLKASSRAYYILMILEMLFIDKERINDGFIEDKQRSGLWGKKGRAGIFKKIECDLFEEQHGFEFRTLYIDENTDLFKLFSLLNYLLNDSKSYDLIERARLEMIKCGLPDKNWGNPHENVEIWNKFVDCFDELSTNIKNIINLQQNREMFV